MKWSSVARVGLGAVVGVAMAASSARSETYTTSVLSPGTSIRTDTRPVSIGFYSPSVGRTFVSWMSSDASGSTAVVKEVNHATQTWSADKTVGHSFLDKHNYPSMIAGADNKLYVFHGCHNTPLKMAKSPNTLSTSGTWTD